MTVQPALEELRSQLQGRVVEPGDPDYDEVRSVFYGGEERRPAAIARVASATDVARVVSFTREHGLELAVRSGGHSVARHSVVEGGIVIDLRDMKRLDIDANDRTAWAETGLTAGEYTTAAAEHGLATGFGDTGTVGIGGITLAGGIGYLVRKYGMTIDDLLAAEIVTAQGEKLIVDTESHPELFWAIRGGGGNFGVATRFRFRLHEVGQIYGGMLFMPATPGSIAGLVEETAAAPDELSAIVNVMKAPPMPFLPAELHGRPLVMVLLAHCGSLEDGEKAVDRLRKVAEPLADMARPMSYPEVYPPEEGAFHPLASSKTMFADGFTTSTAARILDSISASDAFLAVTQVRPLGGAMARVPSDATAFAHRDRAFLANVAAIYQSPGEAAEYDAWVRELSKEVGGTPGAYSGFLGVDGQERIGEGYPDATRARLAEVKKRYDPDNFFRLNHNITPA